MFEGRVWGGMGRGVGVGGRGGLGGWGGGGRAGWREGGGGGGGALAGVLEHGVAVLETLWTSTP
eukprot:SAG25_NODE_12058_length_289_cov_0.463158_1_plen_63_part_01